VFPCFGCEGVRVCERENESYRESEKIDREKDRLLGERHRQREGEQKYIVREKEKQIERQCDR